MVAFLLIYVNVYAIFLFFFAKDDGYFKIICNFAAKSFNNNQLTLLKTFKKMKKYLMTGAAAFAMCAAFTSCSHDDIEVLTQSQINKAKYDQTFLKYVGGTIASSQDWGFGATAASRMTRSQDAPAVLSMAQPYSEEWVANYLTTATEPNADNIGDNYDHSSQNNAQFYASQGGLFQKLINNQLYGDALPESATEAVQSWYNANIKDIIATVQWDWNNSGKEEYANQMFDLLKGYSGLNGADYKTFWGLNVNKEHGYVADPTYVTNFKITGSWSGGNISVVETEDADGDPRTVVVTGTWNITEDQKIGGGGKVIVASGGKIVISEGVKLYAVNQAQFVVLPGGEISGDGEIQVTNGTAEGQGNYNAGTIDVGKFNNNFGHFFNYGTLKADVLAGGAGGSSIFNRSLAVIGSTFEDGNSVAPNTRIYNNCQFYCENNMRIRNYEGVGGSALIVGGEFMPMGGTDGSTDPCYVSLAEGALVKCATLYNGASWTGPTSGYAALEITDKITYLNWEDGPEKGGYFANNIYVKAGTWTNVPAGKGKGQTDPTDTDNYNQSIADYKFFTIVANCVGNGGVKKVEDGDTELIPADADFKLGEAGCTPGFKGDIPVVREYDLRIIGEDLSAEEAGDFDFNDVVFDVKYDAENAYIKLLAAGGTLKLRLDKKDAFEVHELFKVDTDYMVNTNAAGIGRKGNAGRSIKPVEFRLGRGITSAAEAKTITIEVWKNDEWQELTAEKAEPAAKLAVGTDYDWLAERTSIKDEYTGFVEWVNTNDSRLSKWWQVSE